MNNLGIATDGAGNPEAALALYQEAIRLDPGLEVAWRNAVNIARSLGRLDEAADYLREGIARLGATPALQDEAYQIAFVRGDEAEMRRLEESVDHASRLAGSIGARLAATGRMRAAALVLARQLYIK